MPSPKLLLLDEPTAGVDPKARRDFWNEIHALAADGLTVLVSTHYMDEAERCHEIAYIAYGHLLVHGTVEEVIAKSALTTYTVTGEDLNELTAALTGKAGIDMVAPFGTSLHVSGRDVAALEASIAPWREKSGLRWHKSSPSLEDVSHRIDEPFQGQFPMSAVDRPAPAREIRERFGFLRRSYAMLIKEFIQLGRDRVSFAMIVMLPVMQLLLFGYAINTTPHNLPSAVLLQEDSDLARSILKALENTAYFRFIYEVHDVDDFDNLLKSGKVLFGVEIPRGFERAVRRGDRPALLVAADATDPVAASAAIGSLGMVVQTALKHDLYIGNPPEMPFEIRAHARYNPAAASSLNIVPGLVGTILTMTMLIFTALSVTREVERGTMESLLSMPIRPVEVMFGKIIPYVLVGFVQAFLIIGIGVGLFGVPVLGNLFLLALLSTLFITTNLAIGYTISTLVQNQLQAMQMSMMFFLPSILLSGFMFPVCRDAGLGAICRRMPAADALSPHRPRHHAEGREHAKFAFRRAGAGSPDAARHDHRRDALPPHAGLRQDAAGIKGAGWSVLRAGRPGSMPSCPRTSSAS
ncbi:ABC-type multidrug transport system permease subunit [Bradyrhizobium sp. F1.13.4]